MEGKQERFCQEYLIDLNATQAAIRAGYSEKTAQQISSNLLLKVVIQDYIAELKSERNKKTKITQEEIALDLIEIKNRCMESTQVTKWDFGLKMYVPVTDDDGNAVYEFNPVAATKALDILAKHTGFFEVDNQQKSNIVVDIADEP